jgi:hypothetical protein
MLLCRETMDEPEPITQWVGSTNLYCVQNVIPAVLFGHHNFALHIGNLGILASESRHKVQLCRWNKWSTSIERRVSGEF